MNREIQKLEEAIAQLSIQDERRPSQEMNMPDKYLVVAFSLATARCLGRKPPGSEKIWNRRVVANFGAPVVVIAKLWELITNNLEKRPSGMKYDHLLWTMHKLKVYSSESVMVSIVNSPDEKTFRKWTDFFIQELFNLKDQVISWENRLIDDVGNDCLTPPCLSLQE